MTRSPEETTYRIPAANLAELETTFERLNKRAERKGIPGRLELTIVDRLALRLVTDGGGAREVEAAYQVRPGEHVIGTRRYVVVEVAGTRPHHNGWTFIATLQHTEHGAIMRTVPGESVPVEYRTRARWCDHCQKIRRRNDTYVVRHDDGRVLQVGSTCLADFLPGKDAAQMAAMAQYLVEAAATCGEYSEGGGHGGPFTVDSAYFLATINSVIRRDGWLSKSAAYDGGVATSTKAFDLVYDFAHPTSDNRELRELYGRPTEEDLRVAAATLEWAASVIAGGNEYLWNVHLACREPVTYRTAGIVGSAVVAYQRATEQEIRRQQRASATAARVKGSQHIGVVGQRSEFTLTVVRHRNFESRQYGSTTWVHLVDAAGNEVLWKGSGYLNDEWAVGETYRVKATVVKHGEYNGGAQTEVKRVALVAQQTAVAA